MAVISLSLIESSEQIVDGIPRSISLSTNITSTIFYTLDGSDPTVMSNIYIGPITTNSAMLSLTLKAFATNGTDTSAQIIETYSSSALNIRKSHAAASGQNLTENDYPFGTGSTEIGSTFSNNSIIILSTPDNTNNPAGYDGNGNQNAFTDKPFNNENYSVKYTEPYRANGKGGVGTLPATVTIRFVDPPPETTNAYSNLFDPKALVIFQDQADETLDDVPQLNRVMFSMPKSDHDFDGKKFTTSAYDSGSSTTAHFVKSTFNPKTNEITYYYRDARTDRWVISKQPYQNTGTWSNNLSPLVLSKNAGVGMIFEWHLVRRRLW